MQKLNSFAHISPNPLSIPHFPSPHQHQLWYIAKPLHSRSWLKNSGGARETDRLGGLHTRLCHTHSHTPGTVAKNTNTYTHFLKFTYRLSVVWGVWVCLCVVVHVWLVGWRRRQLLVFHSFIRSGKYYQITTVLLILFSIHYPHCVKYVGYVDRTYRSRNYGYHMFITFIHICTCVYFVIFVSIH